MADIFQVYNRCGSCRHFRLQFTDRMGRAMGTCMGKPTHPDVSGNDFGCPEYHVDRARILPGSPVPADADLSPRQREQAKRAELVRLAEARGNRQHDDTQRVRMVRAQEPPAVVRRRVDDIPLGDEEAKTMQRDELKSLLAEVLDEALGLSQAPIHPRFAGGKVLIQPTNPELQAKELDAEVLLRKITAVRDRLRLLEQKINASDKLDQADKVQIQQYITGCYGSLTSFNFLFRDREDWFVGESSK